MPDPQTGFGDDTGAVPAEVAEALDRYAADPRSYPVALHALQRSRLLLAVLEVPADTFPEHDHAHHHPHAPAATAMAAALVQREDGRRALVAFTGLGPLRRWNERARPLPMSTRTAAETARSEGAVALLVDPAGPTTLVVQGEDLVGVAEGWTLARVGERTAWIRPAPE